MLLGFLLPLKALCGPLFIFARPIYILPCGTSRPVATLTYSLFQGGQATLLRISSGPSTVIGAAPDLMFPGEEFMVAIA